jgi:large subunit ribosomal protein L21
MYAVIRAGGKQYRVAPGDVIRIEKLATEPGPNHEVEFREVLAVSSAEGQIGRPQGEALVMGRVVGEGRGDKILVFHYKRKKQYKRLRGHRQPFTAVRITEVTFDGQRFTAPEEPARAPKAKPAEPPAEAPEAAQAAAPAKAKAAAKKKAAAHHAGGAKASASKSKGAHPAPKKKKK